MTLMKSIQQPTQSMNRFGRWALMAAIALPLWSASVAQAIPENQVQRLLSTGQCAGCNLSNADLREAHLIGADLRNANLSGANLEGANLEGADLTGANLTDANLTKAFFTHADLRWANLTRTNLDAAIAYRVDTRWARLINVNITTASQVQDIWVGVGGGDDGPGVPRHKDVIPQTW